MDNRKMSALGFAILTFNDNIARTKKENPNATPEKITDLVREALDSMVLMLNVFGYDVVEKTNEVD